MSIIRSVIIALCIAYLLFGLFLFLYQHKSIYFPDQTDFASCPTFRDAQKITHDGTRMYYTPKSDHVVIVFHGNAGSACDRILLKNLLDDANVSSLFVEYAGYAGDSHRPSRDAILADATHAMAFAKSLHPKRILVLSESIGGGPATYLARDNPDKIILLSPFSRLFDVAQKTYWMYPVRLLLRGDYDNIAWLQQYTGQVAIIHGTADTIIPITLSRKLFASITGDKRMYEIAGAGHNDVLQFDETLDALRAELR